MFSSEHGPDIEMVSNASEFLGDALNIRDNDCALVYCVPSKMAVSRWLHYGVKEFFWAFITHRVVGIATGYGLDDREVGVRAPVESRIFSCPRRPDRL
jgi:hypothetical protein